MKINSMHAALALAIAFFAFSLHAFGKGGETGNGGTIIVDGDSYQLSDLEFIATPGKPLALDQALLEAINADASPISAGTYIKDFGSHFVAKVLDPLIEYRFVSTLPTECIPTQSGIGCAQGSVTFLAVKEFLALSLESKAETILEVRAAALSIDPVFNELAQNAIRALVTKFKSESQIVPFVVLYTDEELQGINQLIESNYRPSDTSEPSWYRVVQGGGRIILQNNRYSNSAIPPTLAINGSTIDVKSSITITGGSSVNLDHSQVIESSLFATIVNLDHCEVIGVSMNSYYNSAVPIQCKNKMIQGSL